MLPINKKRDEEGEVLTVTITGSSFLILLIERLVPIRH